MKLLGILLLFAFFSECSASQGNEDVYSADGYQDGEYTDQYVEGADGYYYYYDEDSETNEHDNTRDHLEVLKGYRESGILSQPFDSEDIPPPIASLSYLNNSANHFGCVLRSSNIVLYDENGVRISPGASVNEEEQEVTSHVDAKNETAFSENGTQIEEDGTVKKKKRKSFSEIQASKAEERDKKELRKKSSSQYPLFTLGPDCERLTCGACKVNVQEFARAILREVDNSNFTYISEVGNMFCEDREFSIRHTPAVSTMCKTLFTSTYIGLISRTFESKIGSLESLRDEATILDVQRKICIGTGACERRDFIFSESPEDISQNHWNTTCFMCQYFMNHVEEQIALKAFVSEGIASEIVLGACGKLDFSDEDKSHLCRRLFESGIIDSVSWMTYLHKDDISNGRKGKQLFKDKVCESIAMCQPYLDPETKREVLEKEEVIEVFS